jgi:flagellar protein FliS
MNAHPQRAYTETLVRGATPVGLIVLLHDVAIKSLRQAQRAVLHSDVEGCSRALNHVLAILAELQGSLDFERGGDVAAHLHRFYELSRAKVLEASIKSSVGILEALADQLGQQRSAWVQADEASTLPAGAAQVMELPVTGSVPRREATAAGRWSA